MSSDPFDMFSPKTTNASKYYSGPYYSNYVENPERLSKNAFWIALGVVALVFIIILVSLLFASRHIISSEDVDNIDEHRQ